MYGILKIIELRRKNHYCIFIVFYTKSDNPTDK